MDVKNLLGKLHAQEGGTGEAPQETVQKPMAPKIPKVPQAPRTPVIEDQVQAVPRKTIFMDTASGGNNMADNLEEGIILDLGEGISLNIPIQRRMSLNDFIKLAEKVKALEMLSESNEAYKRGSL